MDFGDILDDWERRSAKPGGLEGASEAERRAREAEEGRARERREAAEREAREKTAVRYSLESWLEEHGVEDKDAAPRRDPSREAENARLSALKPQARLDLHGMTVAEAEAAVMAFLESASRSGMEKVLVVTGKGIHSKDGPVLGKAARRAVEASPWAGRFGTARPSEGGTGALWILVKRGLISRGR